MQLLLYFLSHLFVCSLSCLIDEYRLRVYIFKNENNNKNISYKCYICVYKQSENQQQSKKTRAFQIYNKVSLFLKLQDIFLLKSGQIMEV